MQEKIIKKFEIKNLGELNDTLGYFEADLAVYGNVDQGNEIIEFGAFGDINSTKKFPLLADHDTRKVIGHFFADSTNTKALKIKGYLNFARDSETKSLLVPKAGEKYANLKNGDISGFSVGFVCSKGCSIFEEINGTDIRRFTKNLQLREGSVVTFAMNERAELGLIKSEDVTNNIDKTMSKELNNNKIELKTKNLEKIKSIKDAEEILKEYGFSSKGAKTIISKIKSFKELESRDDDSGEDEDKSKRDANLKSLSKSFSSLEKKMDFQELEDQLEKINNLI